MKKDSAGMRAAVCGGYCTYYKPGRNEEMSCGGYLLLERMAGEGALPVRGLPPRVPHKLSVPLSLVLCPACPYYRSDCDFAEGLEGAPPCGGFIVIAGMLGKGYLHVDDLRELL